MRWDYFSFKNSKPYQTITAKIAPDLFEFKENTRSVLLHESMFDAEIEQIRG